MDPRIRRRCAPAALVAAMLVSACAATHPRPATPAEQAGWAQPSSSEEIHAFLAGLAQRSPVARLETIGHSVFGTPIEALILSRDPDALLETPRRTERLTVLLVGSQHGNEPSGTEALLELARDVATGPDEEMLDELDLVVLANANPDGRDRGKRGNGNGVNLNTDFNELSQPESRAIETALHRWRPEAVLDIHESAVFKPSTLARQGYMTDVEAQFETATNPNVDPGLAALAREQILPTVLAETAARGLRARRYLGEITSLSQSIKHGGLSARNLRTKAGLEGTVSFLVENRLDPKNGVYPTPRNLKARAAKQRHSIDAFLATMRMHRDLVRERVDAARDPARQPPREIALVAHAVIHSSRPEIRVRLRRIRDGALVEHAFAYHGVVAKGVRIEPPDAYVVTAHQDEIREVLDRNHLEYEVLASDRAAIVDVHRIDSARRFEGRFGTGWQHIETTPRRTEGPAPAGALWVPTAQSAGVLVPLLLDPRSNSTIFQEPEFARLVHIGSDFAVQTAVVDSRDFASEPDVTRPPRTARSRRR